MQKNWIRLASVLMILGISLGAFGAHFLKERIDVDSLKAFQTGILYHLLHGLALLSISLTHTSPNAMLNRAKIFMVIGIVLFSGSLYLLATKELFGIQAIAGIIGPITPIGGIAFILAWVFLFLSPKSNNA